MNGISENYTAMHEWMDDKWVCMSAPLPKGFKPCAYEVMARISAFVLGIIIYPSERACERGLDLLEKIAPNFAKNFRDPNWIDDNYIISKKFKLMDRFDSKINPSEEDEELIALANSFPKFIGINLLSLLSLVHKRYKPEKHYSLHEIAKLLLNAGILEKIIPTNAKLVLDYTDFEDLDVNEYVILSDGCAYGISKEHTEAEYFIRNKDNLISPYNRQVFKETNLYDYMKQFEVTESEVIEISPEELERRTKENRFIAHLNLMILEILSDQFDESSFIPVLAELSAENKLEILNKKVPIVIQWVLARNDQRATNLEEYLEVFQLFDLKFAAVRLHYIINAKDHDVRDKEILKDIETYIDDLKEGDDHIITMSLRALFSSFLSSSNNISHLFITQNIVDGLKKDNNIVLETNMTVELVKYLYENQGVVSYEDQILYLEEIIACTKGFE